MKESYSQNHYKVIEIEQGYQFTTIAGVSYFLTFIQYPSVSEFLSTNIYMFNIDRNEIEVTCGQNDEKVKNTVIYVLELFFRKHEDALITVCDIADGKQYARKRLFDTWFKQYNENRLIKLDANCEIEGCQTFASLYYSANHYNRENLEQEFNKLIELNFYS